MELTHVTVPGNGDARILWAEPLAAVLKTANRETPRGTEHLLIERLRGELAQAQQQLVGRQELEESLATSQEQIQRLQSQCQSLEARESTHKITSTQYHASKEALARAEKQVQELQGRYQTLEARAAAQKTEPRQISQLREQHAAEVSALRATIQGQEAKIAELEEVASKAVQDNNALYPAKERLRAELATTTSLLHQEALQRRTYLELWLSLRGSFRTAIRIKSVPAPGRFPRFTLQRAREGHDLLSIEREQPSAMGGRPRHNKKTFKADRIFEPTADNHTVWEEIQPLLDSAYDGAHVLVVTYGRTGTGKSYTIQGLLERVGEVVFDNEEAAGEAEAADLEGPSHSQECRACVLYLEIYKGQLFDLLDAEARKGLAVPKNSNALVDLHSLGAVSAPVSTATELGSLLARATALRQTAETRINATSSRSHAIVTLRLETPLGEPTPAAYRGSITFVDLAGHERATESGADEQETKAINLSLSEFGHAMRRLREQGRAPRSGPPKINSGAGVWSSKELLPRVLGGLLEGAGPPGDTPLHAKVLLLATVDVLSSDAAAAAAEETLEFVNVVSGVGQAAT